ncbi:hypothetical protein D8674_026695 [Pyrus ussuriensis x Pyrus communis]|uniref:Uncharacterized protein n=1 Tax=Pyrus ussuriensis x Pyrus communis TaxID=2448454 RepID=A0A5N5IC35_9ROSA|nr:hypothetical protein D8674_026695 [Pyrus ussuriensis x Pyrus communis]
MASISSVHPAPHANFDTHFDPSMIRVHNKEEEKAFIHLLDSCKVWWEVGHDVRGLFPKPYNPRRPCSRIHPCVTG